MEKVSEKLMPFLPGGPAPAAVQVGVCPPQGSVPAWCWALRELGFRCVIVLGNKAGVPWRRACWGTSALNLPHILCLVPVSGLGMTVYLQSCIRAPFLQLVKVFLVSVAAEQLGGSKEAHMGRHHPCSDVCQGLAGLKTR